MSLSVKMLCASIITLFVTGCGGGKNNPFDFDIKEPVKITKENAKQAASAGLRVFDVGKVGTVGAVVVLALVNGGAVASGEQSMTCQQFFNSPSGSGNVVIKLTDADGDAQFNRGDSVSLTFSDCVEPSKKIKLAGSMKITLDPQICKATSTVRQWTYGGIVEISELKGISTAGNKTDNRTTKGSITFCAQPTGASGLTEQYKTSEFTVQTSSDTLTLTDVTVDATTDLATTAYSQSAVAQRVASKVLKGDFRVSTGTFFSTNAKAFVGIGSEFPHEGELEVSAAFTSKVRISAVDNTNVILSTDLDGDQVFESTETVTWESLL